MQNFDQIGSYRALEVELVFHELLQFKWLA